MELAFATSTDQAAQVGEITDVNVLHYLFDYSDI